MSLSDVLASVENQDIYTCRHFEHWEGRHKPTKWNIETTNIKINPHICTNVFQIFRVLMDEVKFLSLVIKGYLDNHIHLFCWKHFTRNRKKYKYSCDLLFKKFLFQLNVQLCQTKFYHFKLVIKINVQNVKSELIHFAYDDL